MTTILLAILILGVLIFVHEAGHFLVAKWCKVGVLEFAIGFGKCLFSREINGTRYSLRAIPLGGYVRMVGDDPTLQDDQTAGTNPAGILEGHSSELSPAAQAMIMDRSTWFLNKSYWAKAAIVLAGPLANILFAIPLVSMTLYFWGEKDFVGEPVVGTVIPGLPAEKAGLLSKDRILEIDGQPITTASQIAQAVINSEEKTLNFQVERGASILTIAVTPTLETGDFGVILGQKDKKPDPAIGITFSYQRKPVPLGEALIAAPYSLYRLISFTLFSIKLMVTGQISANNIQGPIFIVGEAKKSADRGMAELLEFIIILSVSLAIFNLLPIPILDGGHLMFFTIEKILGRPVSLRFLAIANQVGFVLILLLMALAIKNDLVRLFS